MGILKPLRVTLFFYEVFRLLLLVCLLFIVAQDSGFPGGSAGSGDFFPYLAYLSANALFPLMALFLWLRLEEYRNYLPLYIAGKIIAVVSFYAWEFLSSREFPGAENLVKSMVLMGGSVFISLADTLSVWGAWTLKNKCEKALSAGINDGSRQTSIDSLGNGGV